MTKCKGCGITLQNADKNSPGFSEKLDNKYCERCFRITNYNDHNIECKNIDNNKLLDSINKKKALKVFLCDIFNLNYDNMLLYEKMKEPKVFVVTKCDVISKNFMFQNLEKNIKNTYDVDKLMFFSIKNGYGKNELFKLMSEYKEVLFSGPTCSGKSSLINYLFNQKLTVSNYKNTTQDFIEIKIDDLKIIDAPGFNDVNSGNYSKDSGYIKPKTLRLKKGYSLIINDEEIYFDDTVNLTLFLTKNAKIITKKIKNEISNMVALPSDQDFVIKNVGFVYIKSMCVMHFYSNNNVEIRQSIVGAK